MDERLPAAAAAMKMSAKMVQRSAEAKAKAQGVSVEAILAEWAGVDAPAAAAPEAAAPAAPPAPEATAAPATAAAPPAPDAGAPPGGAAGGGEGAGRPPPPPPARPPAARAPAAPPGPAVEVIGEVSEPVEPPPPQATPAKKERIVPVGALPRWLAALFLVIPAFAIAYLTFLPNGPNCGDAGRLGVDQVTGEVANCDGSALGSTGGGPYTVGQTVYQTVGCAACHGAGGAGGGNFPALTGDALLTTFPTGQCAA